MAYFPMFVDLGAKASLVIGSGRIALQRVKKLALYGGKIVVASDNFKAEFLSAIDGIPHIKTTKTNIDRSFIASVSPALAAVCPGEFCGIDAREISQLFAEKQIPVNVADVPELCTFVFPAATVRGSLSIGVCTSGNVPGASAEIKNKIEEILPSGIEAIIDALAKVRSQLRDTIPDTKVRRLVLQSITSKCIEQNVCPDDELIRCETEFFLNGLHNY